MRIFKVKEAVIINSEFEEKAVFEWLGENQPEVEWGRDAVLYYSGLIELRNTQNQESMYPYYLLRSSYDCFEFASIDSDIADEGYTVINLDLLGKELPKEEGPFDTVSRLILDRAVVKTSYNLGNSFYDRDTMEIVLNGNIMTDEYYQELREAINKLECSIQFTVTIKY